MGLAKPLVGQGFDIYDFQAPIPARFLAENRERFVTRAVIHGNNFQCRIVNFRKGCQCPWKLVLLISCRENQRDAWAMLNLTRRLVLQMRQAKRSPPDSYTLNDPKYCNEGKKKETSEVHGLVFNAADTVS